MSSGYNKRLKEWSSTVIQDFTPAEDWIVDPVFIDRDRCDQFGPQYWKFNGNEISCMTDEEIDVDPTFIAQAKITRVEELNNMCRQAIINGFQSSALGVAYIYDSELEDQLNLIGSVTATAPTTENPNGTSQY